MDLATEQTLCEINVCTKSDRCHYVGSGIYHYFVDHMDFPNAKQLRLGLKNIQLPLLAKEISFKIWFGPKDATFKESMMQEHKTRFINCEELCDIVQSIANNNVIVSKDMPKPLKTLQLYYKNNRFYMEIYSDLKLVISSKLAKEMGFMESILSTFSPEEKKTKTEKQLLDVDKQVPFTKNMYISNDYTTFIDEINAKLVLVLFDKIEGFTLMADGGRYPVFFNYDIMEQSKKSYKLLTVKKMLDNKLTEFRFGIFNAAMEPFMYSLNLEDHPIKFTLIIFDS